MRRTKIIATVGPATDRPGIIEKLIQTGVDLFRVNYSHQNHADHEIRVNRIRDLSRTLGIEVGIIADLQGPKIRIERFSEGSVLLKEGETFTLDSTLDWDAGDQHQVGISYRHLARDVQPGQTILLDDGRIALEVTGTDGEKIQCRVSVGGELSNNKGINLLGGGLTAKALTDKDRIDLQHGIGLGADFFAVSFVRNPEDIQETKQLITDAGSKAGIIAKLERAEAIDNAQEIIDVSDAIMIARGDLGVEIGDAALPPVQKRLINMARSLDRAVITATQMMESMINHQTPCWTGPTP